MDAVLLGKMLDAGFTKEEIMKLIPEEPKQKAPDPEPEPGPAADNNAAMEKRLSGIEKSISDLMKTIQAENRKHDSIGGLPESLDEETDRIMKGIIRPETKRKDV